jgi:hypothetical protein
VASNGNWICSAATGICGAALNPIAVFLLAAAASQLEINEMICRPSVTLHTARNLLLICVAMPVSAAIFAAPAHALFHFNSIEELYTNASGTLQYIQLYSASGDQQFVSGLQIQVVNEGGTQTHSLTMPNDLPGDTTDKFWLIGTAGIDAAGAPTPDFIMPNNFLFIGGGTINFFGANPGSYDDLPTDGINARRFGTSSNVPNLARNFQGESGAIVPEPASVMLLLLLGIALSGARLRRRP